MNTRSFLAALREALERGGVENAAFEARTLLEIVLGKTARRARMSVTLRFPMRRPRRPKRC